MRESDLQKIFWHSRRGMLELDLLLVPFATEAYRNLSPQDKALYREFLGQEDQDLFAWLLQRDPPSEPRFQSIIEKILNHRAGNKGKNRRG